MSPDVPPCWNLRTRVVGGPGTVSRLGEVARGLGMRRILCVTDPGIVRAGHLDVARRALESRGLPVTVFDAVHENPTTLDVEAGREVARSAAVDGIVALGGGSSMDCAKGIDLLVSRGGRVEDYQGKDRSAGPLLPMVAVPTTAGTGSEVQSFALISDPVTHRKMACGDREAAPAVAVLDPELTLTLPRAITATTGIDALSHAVESFVSTARTTTSGDLSRHAWKLLARSFERVLEAPEDLAARGAMLYGACWAGAAIENSMLGAAHSTANPLTAEHGVVHGQAVGLMLPHVVRFNGEACAEDYRELLELAGLAPPGDEPAAEALARLLERFLDAAGFPRHLADVGVRTDECARLSGDAARQWTAKFNPRPVGEPELLSLYRSAL